MVASYAFPNVYIGIGSSNDFVKDIQKVLGLEVSGEFDFVTMCYVTVHKHKNGLNHADPVVDQETWNTLFKVDPTPTTQTSTDLLQSVSSPGSTAVTPRNEEINPTTTTGTTEATAQNAPAPDEKPVIKTDANTTTAQEQQQQQEPTAEAFKTTVPETDSWLTGLDAGEQVGEPRPGAAQVPDVHDRSGQLDVAHPLAADLRAGDLDAAALADDALEAHPLVLAAVALPVVVGPKIFSQNRPSFSGRSVR